MDQYEYAALMRLEQLGTARMQTITNLQQYRTTGDVDGMGEEIERLAKIDDSIRSINDLHQRHQQSKMAPQQATQTRDEWLAKSPEKCDWSDTYRMMTDHNGNSAGSLRLTGTPQEQRAAMDRAFQQGLTEVMRRKQAGE